MFHSNPFFVPKSQLRSYFGLLVLLLGSSSCAASPQQVMTTALRLAEGSIPPVGGPFGCVVDLDGKPYSSELVQNCVKLITKTSYVLDVRVESNDLPNGRMFTEFVVRAKALPTKELTFVVQQEELPPLQEWLKRNPNNLRLGGIYSAAAESSTYQGIRQFYLARGVLVGIVPTVRLDYNEGIASINFEIIKGPSVPPQPEYFPYGGTCQDELTYMDWSQVDEFVPIPLVESQIKLRSLGGCFTPEFVKQDQDALRKLGIFQDVAINYSGSNGSRHVSVKLKGKPLSVAEIGVRTFGNYSNCAENHKQDLALKVTETYTAASAHKSGEYLEQACSGPGRWVEVNEEDHLTEGGQLRVFFNVLVFPLQTVFVDEKKVN
jgi:hypothetical protein